LTLQKAVVFGFNNELVIKIAEEVKRLQTLIKAEAYNDPSLMLRTQRAINVIAGLT
jgi:hypothetical protein